jgi:predicted deacylase
VAESNPEESSFEIGAGSRGRRRVIRVGETEIQPGERRRLELPLARLFTGTWLSLPVEVINGVEPGPRLMLDAAIHGDEVNGVEIIRQILDRLDPKALRGIVVAVPVVNVFGFVQQNRYLPDRRDLNRSFPGSASGSLAAQMAHLFTQEVVKRCDYGLDLHTGSLHRSNLPQIRGNLKDGETRAMAEAFGAPLMFHPKNIQGSLRATAPKLGMKLLVYETGEPLRIDAEGVRVGVEGSLRVMELLGMGNFSVPAAAPPFEAATTRWVRARRSGMFHLEVELGERVKARQRLGFITDPLEGTTRPVRSPFDGIVIGFTNNPLIHLGDALLHLARGDRPKKGQSESRRET